MEVGMSQILRPVDATRPPGAVRRAYSWLAATRAALFFSRHVCWKLDPVLLRVTGGRLCSTLMIRTAVLETRGARTGERRRNTVIYWNDGDSVVIAASQAGSPKNPAWYHNAIAAGDVLLGDEPMHVKIVDDEAEQARLWAMGDRVFPAFPKYRHRALRAGRTVPLLRLSAGIVNDR
jgi:deazaflavin-dependent oxidoreductase (nitroreductase family)